MGEDGGARGQGAHTTDTTESEKWKDGTVTPPRHTGERGIHFCLLQSTSNLPLFGSAATIFAKQKHLMFVIGSSVGAEPPCPSEGKG